MIKAHTKQLQAVLDKMQAEIAELKKDAAEYQERWRDCEAENRKFAEVSLTQIELNAKQLVEIADQRRVMQMALEALEWNWGGEPIPSKELEAITALKEALK